MYFCHIHSPPPTPPRTMSDSWATQLYVLCSLSLSEKKKQTTKPHHESSLYWLVLDCTCLVLSLMLAEWYGQYTQCHPIEENCLSLYQLISMTNRLLAKCRTSGPPFLLHSGLFSVSHFCRFCPCCQSLWVHVNTSFVSSGKLCLLKAPLVTTIFPPPLSFNIDP